MDLHKRGFDVNIRSRVGSETPLTYAILSNRIETVRLLISIGADPFCFFVGDECFKLRILSRVNNVDILRFLLECGVDPDEEAIIETFKRREQWDMVELLASVGLDPRLTGSELYYAQRSWGDGIHLAMSDPSLAMFDKKKSFSERVGHIIRFAPEKGSLARIAAVQIFSHRGPGEEAARAAAMDLVKIEYYLRTHRHSEPAVLRSIGAEDKARLQRELFPLGWQARMLRAAIGRGARGTVHRVLGWAEKNGEGASWVVDAHSAATSLIAGHSVYSRPRARARADAVAWDVADVVDASRLE
jgi:hypothetical protein